MGKVDLPPERQGETLDYRRLISALAALDGETVVVRLSTVEEDGISTPGVASIIGELRHQLPARYEGHEFSIGSPYPDRYPSHLAGGIFFISERVFRSATLSTFDGNDYFAITIETRDMKILVQDGASTYP